MEQLRKSPTLGITMATTVSKWWLSTATTSFVKTIMLLQWLKTQTHTKPPNSSTVDTIDALLRTQWCNSKKRTVTSS